MSEKDTVSYTNEEIDKRLAAGKDRTDWKRLRDMTEEEIDTAALSDPDAQPTDYDFWREAELVTRLPKKSIHLRVDQDVYDWFKSQGSGHLTRMNAVLKTYVEAKKGQEGETRK